MTTRSNRNGYQSGFGNEFATEAVAGHLAGRPELAAESRARPVRRADVRHRVHRAAQAEPAQLAVPHPPGGDARHVRAVRAGRISTTISTHGPVTPNQLRWNPLPLPDGADRFRRRPLHDGRQRLAGRAHRRRHPPVRGEPLDAGALLLRRRRRAADRAAAGPAAHRDRTRRARGRAAGNRGDPARHPLPRRAAGRRIARLRLRELRRAAAPAGPRPDRLATASPTRAIS